MAENKNEKKKTTTANKNTKKKTTTNTKKKTTNVKNSKPSTTKKGTTKKVATKKKTTQAKKTTAKQVVKKTPVKTETKKVVEKTIKDVEKQSRVEEKPIKVVEQPKQITKEEIKKQEDLEKTLIFDGRQNKNLLEVVEKLEEKNVVLEDKVIKRSKAKKIIIIVLTAIIFAIIATTVWYAIDGEITARENNQTLNSNIYMKVYKNYKTISEINKQEEKDKLEQENAANSIEEIEYSNIKTITLTEFERMILEKKEFTVLVASSTCYPCLTYEPIINEVYEERETTIYRINISMLTENEITRFRTYYAFKLTPTIFTIKDGIAAFEKTGSSTKEELIDWLDKNV